MPGSSHTVLRYRRFQSNRRQSSRHVRCEIVKIRLKGCDIARLELIEWIPINAYDFGLENLGLAVCKRSTDRVELESGNCRRVFDADEINYVLASRVRRQGYLFNERLVPGPDRPDNVEIRKHL